VSDDHSPNADVEAFLVAAPGVVANRALEMPVERPPASDLLK